MTSIDDIADLHASGMGRLATIAGRRDISRLYRKARLEQQVCAAIRRRRADSASALRTLSAEAAGLIPPKSRCGLTSGTPA